ncbi:IS200/IS605 family transposase [Belliella marina]|uniref:IS200/IS605 family transposase n=1 Tax=Belliella marina TaxID=1644146 RepID=A0ABW4VU77_9BACT
MGQSLVKNYIHIIFSTKHRKPMIKSEFESRIHSYLGGICNQYESNPIIVGGYFDHVHILCLLSKKISIMDLVKEIKSKSSKWVKTLSPELASFYWQDGYGAFSVNPGQVGLVVQYIKNQHQHHLKKTFQDEHRSFLEKYKVEYDEKYVWD